MVEPSLYVETYVSEGDPAEVIVRYAEQHPEVSTFVMSTPGRSGLGRWLFGSVAEKVLHSTPVPLLLVRPTVQKEEEEPDLADIPRYRTLLVPLDGSAFAEQALDVAAGLARAMDARLVLIAVTSKPFDLKLMKTEATAEWSTIPGDTPAEHLVKYLDAITQKLATAEVPASAEVSYGDTTEEILKAAKFAGADIIVLATHGRGGLGRMMIGSVAMRVAQAAPIPVLLVRARQEAEEPPERGRANQHGADQHERGEDPAGDCVAASAGPAIEEGSSTPREARDRTMGTRNGATALVK
jgi:nucleotide-binding universal stress UspA family protein